jgi:hypothetical protein
MALTAMKAMTAMCWNQVTACRCVEQQLRDDGATESLSMLIEISGA